MPTNDILPELLTDGEVKLPGTCVLNTRNVVEAPTVVNANQTESGHKDTGTGTGRTPQF